MRHDEQLKYATEHNEAFAALHSKYQVAAAMAEKLLGIPLSYKSKPIKAPVEEALKQFPAQGQNKHLEAKQAFEAVTSLRKSLQQAKRKIMKRYSEAKQFEKGKEVAGLTSAPITRDTMQQAQDTLKGRRPELARLRHPQPRHE